MSFDYFYGQQSDLFTFYRVPKVLFTNKRFWNISADAKMLYGILLDRMSLSAKNGWIDKNGRVYCRLQSIPSMQSLYEEFHQLAVQKKQDYAEYRQIRKEKEELLIAKRTVETILNIDRQKEQEKEQDKEEKKNFR